jgi:hypothetical protein
MSTTLPEWVRKRDGRIVPFDSDVICLDLFRASEALGRPNVFLARELTDGVVHFLAAEPSDGATTAAIAELVVKVVRELRHPELAQAFADRPPAALPAESSTPWEIAGQALRRFTLDTVFTRDLAAAEAEGLVHLDCLECPLEIAAAVLPPRGSAALERLQEMVDMRAAVGGWLVIDGPEYDFWAAEPDTFGQVLALAASATRLGIRVQLNCAEPPLWAVETALGPLFHELSRPAAPRETALELLDALLAQDSFRVHVDWHLAERDFDSSQTAYLARLAETALAGSDLTFNFDRPRRPILLGPGIDRKHPAMLMCVFLDLPQLLKNREAAADLENFHAKVGSLARLAVSAGVQKRRYLRQRMRERLASSFLEQNLLLERARLMVCPAGLDMVVQQLTGGSWSDLPAALDLAQKIIRQLCDTLGTESRRRQLDCVLDQPARKNHAAVANIAPEQLKSLGLLHGVSGTGTATVVLENLPSSGKQFVKWLEFAWRHTEITRLRFRVPRMGEQPTLAM